MEESRPVPNDDEHAAGDQEPGDEHAFFLKERHEIVGQSGWIGYGLGDSPPPEFERMVPPSGRARDLVCNRCGVVAQGVPASRLWVARLAHEQQAHTEIFAQRLELQQALAALDDVLWRGDRPERRRSHQPDKP